MDNVKEYIKSKFGTYAKLAEVLNLSEGTVKNALSKNDDVSWLNLLKHLSSNRKSEYKILPSRKLANDKAAKYLFQDNATLTRFCKHHRLGSFSGSALDIHQIDKKGRTSQFYFTIAKYNDFQANKEWLISMLDDFFTNDT